MSTRRPKVLDLFCGIGGLSLGLQRAGFDAVGGVDIWEDAARTYEHNHEGRRCLVADVSVVSADDILDFFGVDAAEIGLMAGGPPCQGFSTVGKRQAADPRNTLWTHYLALVDRVRPPYVMIENVEGMVVMDRGGVCEKVVRELAKIGYHCKWRLLRSSDHGVPQLRKRVIFLAWLDGLAEPEFPRPVARPPVTVAEAIFDLPPLAAGESRTTYTRKPTTEFQKARRGKVTRLNNHEAASHPTHLVEILSHIPDGGNRKSIPDRLQPKSGFHNSYSRLASDKPAVAVTSNMRKPSSARATHPTQHRGLTVREGLRLQTFDDSFEVLGSRTSQYLQVGNAVPPLLGEAIGRNVLAAYRQNRPGGIASARKRRTEVKPCVQQRLAFSS
jgi:DNA (cytosine-5)-methyltransferase 1